jgi:hypothetical protein
MSVKDLFQTLWAKRDLSMVRLAAEIGVNRNWLIERRDGKIPRARDGTLTAGADPRYLALGSYLELHGVATRDDFMRQAESERLAHSTINRKGINELYLAVLGHITDMKVRGDAIPAIEIWMYVLRVVERHGADEVDAFVVASAKQWQPTTSPVVPTRVDAALWTLDVGWSDPEDVKRQVGEITTAVLSHGDVHFSLFNAVLSILFRLKDFSPGRLTYVIRQGAS